MRLVHAGHGRAAISGGRERIGDFVQSEILDMHLHLRRFWPAFVLLIAASSVSAAPHNVSVGGTYSSGGYTYPQNGFEPAAITVDVGDTVTFTNAGGTHNVDADDETSFRCANGCDGDGAGGNGDPSGVTWSTTITITPAMAGRTIGYHCDVHGAMGMVGTITVTGAAAGGNVPITAGFTGAWYDPNQSGHGIFIEVLPGNQMLAWWFTFNPDGTQQSWFGNVGAIDGDTATINALQTTGGRWIPNFDPGNVTQPSWGTLVFTFTDCNHGRVDFTSTAAGYGSGHMDLTRITQPAGLSCP
jgi:plastocyanin